MPDAPTTATEAAFVELSPAGQVVPEASRARQLLGDMDVEDDDMMPVDFVEPQVVPSLKWLCEAQTARNISLTNVADVMTYVLPAFLVSERPPRSYIVCVCVCVCVFRRYADFVDAQGLYAACMSYVSRNLDAVVSCSRSRDLQVMAHIVANRDDATWGDLLDPMLDGSAASRARASSHDLPGTAPVDGAKPERVHGLGMVSSLPQDCVKARDRIVARLRPAVAPLLPRMAALFTGWRHARADAGAQVVGGASSEQGVANADEVVAIDAPVPDAGVAVPSTGGDASPVAGALLDYRTHELLQDVRTVARRAKALRKKFASAAALVAAAFVSPQGHRNQGAAHALAEDSNDGSSAAVDGGGAGVNAGTGARSVAAASEGSSARAAAVAPPMQLSDEQVAKIERRRKHAAQLWTLVPPLAHVAVACTSLLSSTSGSTAADDGVRVALDDALPVLRSIAELAALRLPFGFPPPGSAAEAVLRAVAATYGDTFRGASQAYLRLCVCDMMLT